MKTNIVSIALSIGSKQSFDQRNIYKQNYQEIDDMYSTVAWQMILRQ